MVFGSRSSTDLMETALTNELSPVSARGSKDSIDCFSPGATGSASALFCVFNQESQWEPVIEENVSFMQITGKVIVLDFLLVGPGTCHTRPHLPIEKELPTFYSRLVLEVELATSTGRASGTQRGLPSFTSSASE